MKRDNDLARVLEERGKGIIDTLLNRDQLGLNYLNSFTNNLKTINDFQLNLRESMKSLAQKRDELVRGNDSKVVPLAIPPPPEHSSQEPAVPS